MAYAPSDHIWDTILPLYNITPNETSSKVEEFRDYVRWLNAQQSCTVSIINDAPAFPCSFSSRVVNKAHHIRRD